jgi:hypothetical protein
LKRFLKLMVTQRWGWTLIGALVLLTGILWGISSPIIPYMGLSEGSGQIQVFPTKNGDIYVYPTDKSAFFIARHDDFSPPIDSNKIHMDIVLDGVARSDTIRVNDVIGDQPVTDAHVIEKLVLYNLNNKPLGTYTASDYDPNTGGYYENRWWPGASALMAVGLLIASAALFVRRKPIRRPPSGDLMPIP